MTITFNSNIASLLAQRQLSKASRSFEDSVTRLASGSRLNRPSDDAAGLGLSSALRTRARIYTQAIRNGNDGISMLNIAQGSLQSFSDILIRLKELAEQSANGSVSAAQRRALNAETLQLTKEYNRIAGGTTFNGLSLFNPTLGSVAMQLGLGTQAVMNINMSSSLQDNIGVGSFSSPSSFSFAGTITGGIATGDFNGDGNKDAVAVDGQLGSGARIRYGDGNGSSTQTLNNFAALGSPTYVATADMNNDGRDDILISDGSRVYFYEGNANRTVTARGSFNTAVSLTNISIGDIDGDGNKDFVTGGSASAVVTTVKNNGNWSFTSQGTTVLGANQRDLALADLTGDGKLDLVATAVGGLLTAYSSANGMNSLTQFYSATVTGANSLALADYNSDGLSDIGTSGGTVLLSEGDGSFGTSTFTINSAGGTVFDTADFNNDGYADILRAPAAGIEISFGRGDGTFDSPVVSGVAGSGYGTIADFNNDGVLDYYGASGAVGAFYLANTAQSVNLAFNSLLTVEDSLIALDAIDEVLEAVQTQLASVGSSMSRLDSSLSALAGQRDGHEEAASRITDSDIAAETANLTRAAILRQLGSAVLAQANQEPKLALSLLTDIGAKK